MLKPDSAGPEAAWHDADRVRHTGIPHPLVASDLAFAQDAARHHFDNQ